MHGGVLTEVLQDHALRYVSGELPPEARDGFEVLLEADAELRAHTRALQETAAGLLVMQTAPAAPLPEGLKARLLAAVDRLPPPEPEALVLADAAGRVEWVNPAFTALCGYTLDELRGRKPGSLLQGPATDRAAVQRMREALRAGRPCCETLVNYHKDGSPYRVEIRLAPLLDEAGAPVCFAARERKVP